MVIRGHEAIRDAYRDPSVAHRYIEERFDRPLGALLHARQVAAIKALIRRYKPARILEVAPGPARLTRHVSPAFPGRVVLVDASAQMLDEARSRLASHGASCPLIQADAFRLPFTASFDFVYTFRLLRHFESADRSRLYRAIAEVLRPGGWLVFDAVNERVAAPLRASPSAAEYHRHYDALLGVAQLRAELAAASFQLTELRGVQHRFPLLYRLEILVTPRSRHLARLAMEVVDRTGGEPLEWVVTCRRQ